MWRDKVSEFEVQATAYSLLKTAGYIIRGEIKVKPPKGRGCRFDLVIFNKQHDPILVIEVKGPADARPHTKKDYYEKVAQCPCIQISGMSEASDVVNTVRAIL